MQKCKQVHCGRSLSAKNQCLGAPLIQVEWKFTCFAREHCKAKFANGDSMLTSSQFLLLTQLARKMKVDLKIIVLLPKIEICETHCSHRRLFIVLFSSPRLAVDNQFFLNVESMNCFNMFSEKNYS